MRSPLNARPARHFVASQDYLNAQRTACHGLLPADVKKILRACRDNFDRLCLPYLQLVKRTDNLLDFKNLVQKAARHHPDLNIMEMMEGNKYTGAWTDANYSRVKVDIEHIIAWSKLAGNIAHFKFLYASGIFEQRYVPFLGVDVDSTDRDYQVALVASVGVRKLAWHTPSQLPKLNNPADPPLPPCAVGWHPTRGARHGSIVGAEHHSLRGPAAVLVPPPVGRDHACPGRARSGRQRGTPLPHGRDRHRRRGHRRRRAVPALPEAPPGRLLERRGRL
jgi:hypothetical protein